MARYYIKRPRHNVHHATTARTSVSFHVTFKRR